MKMLEQLQSDVQLILDLRCTDWDSLNEHGAARRDSMLGS